MFVAVVRACETKELVGIFWANNVQDLGDAVDEVCSPTGCEFKRLDYGGIYYADKAPAVPFSRTDDDGDWTGSQLPRSTFCERTSTQLDAEVEESEKRWKTFNAAGYEP